MLFFFLIYPQWWQNFLISNFLTTITTTIFFLVYWNRIWIFELTFSLFFLLIFSMYQIICKITVNKVISYFESLKYTCMLICIMNVQILIIFYHNITFRYLSRLENGFNKCKNIQLLFTLNIYMYIVFNFLVFCWYDD